jgi:hypothetical protein
MIIDEEQLSNALHQLADRDGSSRPPVQQLLQRGRRSRRRRTAATAATALAAATAVAAGGFTAIGLTGQQPAPPVASAAAAPVSLALAANSTASAAFRYQLSTTVVLSDGSSSRETEVGAFDPVREVGYLTVRGPFPHEERRIKDTCYLLEDGHGDGLWQVLHAPCGEFDRTERTAGGQTGQSVNPQEVLAQLKTLGTVTYRGRTGSGAAAVDTYSYTSNAVLYGKFPVSYTGQVKVGVTTKKVAEVSYTMTLRAPRPKDRERAVKIVISFADYGTAVDVAIPSNISTATPPVRPKRQPGGSNGG